MSKTEGGPSSPPCTTNPLEWIGIYKGEHAEQKKGQFTRHSVVEIPSRERGEPQLEGPKGGLRSNLRGGARPSVNKKGRLIWSVEGPPERRGRRRVKVLRWFDDDQGIYFVGR